MNPKRKPLKLIPLIIAGQIGAVLSYLILKENFFLPMLFGSLCGWFVGRWSQRRWERKNRDGNADQ